MIYLLCNNKGQVRGMRKAGGEVNEVVKRIENEKSNYQQTIIHLTDSDVQDIKSLSKRGLI